MTLNRDVWGNALMVLILALIVGYACLPVRAQSPQDQGSYNRCLAVTTSDTVDLREFSQNGKLSSMIYVGGAGNVVAVMSDNSTVLFTAPPVGSVLPLAVRRINATSTTATVMVACYRS